MVKTVLNEMLDIALHISKNQEFYDADLDIYGSFADQYQEILLLIKPTSVQ